jgi:hypothetical protein
MDVSLAQRLLPPGSFALSCFDRMRKLAKSLQEMVGSGGFDMRSLLSLPLCMFLACSPTVAESDGKEKPPEVATPKEWRPPDNATMKQLAAKDPIAFLENCVRRYNQDVQCYRVKFHKRERINDKLYDAEEIDVCFREKPLSVRFSWTEGARKAAATLYVEGENDGKLLVKPNGAIASLAGIVKRDPEGSDAKKSGRYSLKEFGLKNSTLRALASWKAAQAENGLHVELVGEEKVKEAGNKTCWILKRTKYKKPERDGVIETTLYFDKETWLQVGSVVRGREGKLIGEYYFCDVQLNPKFDDDTFQREALEKKR